MLTFKIYCKKRTITFMIQFLLALVFLGIAVLAMVMQKTYYYIPQRELKRQAEHHDPLATTLWQAAAYGAALRLLLWILMIVAAGIGFVLLADIAPTILAIIAVGFLLLFTFGWLPNTKLSSVGGRVTVWATPPLVWLLSKTYPLLRWLHRQVGQFASHDHTGLFQREDLVELLESQKKQTDNRISEEELEMAQAALQFGTRRVRDILKPRKQVVAVAASEELGPITMDELHKSRHSRFPVFDGKKDNMVGTLYLYDVVQHKGKSKPRVSEVMEDRVFYVHESDTLAEALQVFYQTQHPLFIVVNSFEEYVGIVTLEDILAQLMGHAIVDAHDQPDNRAEVAAKHPKKEAETEEPVEQADTQPSTEPEQQAVPEPEPSATASKS